MVRFFNHTSTSFASGEMSPKLYGRTDLNQYKNGAREIENFTIMPHGGLTRRMGTQYLASVKTANDKTRLIPFIVSDDTSYVMELGNGYIRFFINKGQLLSSQEITNGTFDSDISGWTDRSAGTGSTAWNAGKLDLVGGGGGNEARTYQGIKLGTSTYTLTVSASNTLNYRIGTAVGSGNIKFGTVTGVGQTISFTPSTAATVYIEFENPNNDTRNIDDVSIDNPIYQIDAPWALSDIFELDYAQSADIMVVTHPDYQQQQIVRFGVNDWEVSDYDLSDGPYYSTVDSNYGAIGTGIDMTYGAIAVGGSGTVTASSAIFASTDVGRPMRLRAATTDNWTWGEITAFTSSTQVTWSNRKNTALNAGTNSKEWRLGYFSDTTGWPAVVSFYEQRLLFANTTDKPQTIFGSEAGNIDGFAEDDGTTDELVLDTSAYVFTIASTKTNSIKWMSPRQQLFIGTFGNTYVLQASSLNEAVTPTNVSVKPADDIGAASIKPVETQNATLFVDQFQSKLLELSFFFEEDSFRSVDLSILSEHLLKESNVDQIDYQPSPDNLIWCVRADGKMLGLTYLRQQKVVGWHTHIIAGEESASNAKVESIAIIPGTNQSDLYMIVRRGINGANTRYVEVMRDAFTEITEKEDIVHLDSSLVLDDSKTIDSVAVNSGDLRVGVTAHGWLVGDQVYIKNNSTLFNDGDTPADINRIWTIAAVVDANTIDLDGTDVTLNGAGRTDGTIAKLVTTISGLDHLEAESVTPYVDGTVQTNKTVSSGSITLDTPGAKVYVGLHYDSKVQTLDLESASSLGNSQGSRKRIIESAVRFYNTLGGKIGFSADDQDPILFRTYSDPLNETPPLVTGDKIIDFPTGWDRGASLLITQDQPLPMTITGIVNKLLISDV